MTGLPRNGALAAVALVAAFALTGCGGDDPGTDQGPGAGAGSGQAAPSASGGEDGGSRKGDAAALEGSWTGESDAAPLALSVTSGKVALAAGQHICQGEVKDMGEVMLSLKCLDGDTERTMGAVESNDGKKLVISWDAGAKDTFSKADAAALPTGLPELPTP